MPFSLFCYAVTFLLLLLYSVKQIGFEDLPLQQIKLLHVHSVSVAIDGQDNC